MRAARKNWLLAGALVSLGGAFVACSSINPQPLPPDGQLSATPEVPGSDSTFGDDDSREPTLADAGTVENAAEDGGGPSEPKVSDGGDGGDAATGDGGPVTDASTDG